MDEPIQYLAPAQVDRLSLRERARKVFSDTFAQFYDPAPFDSFLNEVYGPGGIMERDLGDPAIHWLVAAKGEKPIGYAKLSQHVAPAPNPKPGAMELCQIYVLHTWHGEGIAGCLMEWALNTARFVAFPELYLTVFDYNERAKRFYTRYGFAEVGHCIFTLGGVEHDDAFGTGNCDVVWIAAGATIINGVTVGENSVVVADSVVTRGNLCTS